MTTKINQAILKVARSNPEFRRALREELAAQKDLPLVGEVRKPYYALSDAILQLVNTLRGDRKWNTMVHELEDTRKRMQHHLNQNYIWD